MAKKKVTIPKPKGPQSWEEDSETYPVKRGVCEFCFQKDEIKLSYDMHRYICLNASACLLRWRKNRVKL